MKARSNETRRDVLLRWFIECPNCLEAWLAPDVRENDWHVCRECGQNFVKTSPEKKSASGSANFLS